MSDKSKKSRVLVTGASGMLGGELCRELRGRGYEVVGQSYGLQLGDIVDRGIQVDFERSGAAGKLVYDFAPILVVNCAAMTDVDLCERQPDRAFRLNSEVCGELAQACASIGAKFVTLSTDQLWTNASPFISEAVLPDPPNVYGKTKAQGEEVAKVSGNELVVRTNFFGSATKRKGSAVHSVLSCVKKGKPYQGFEDIFYTPIAAKLLSELLVEAALAGLCGTYNMVGRDRISKLEFAQAVARHFGEDIKLIEAVRASCKKLVAPRPKEMSLSVEKIERDLGVLMPSLEQSLGVTLR